MPRKQIGNLNSDIVNGEKGQDTIFCGKDDDWISGGRGNDWLSGDFGDDLLVGVNLAENNAGINEVNTLTGGTGFDTFVLGDESQSFYVTSVLDKTVSGEGGEWGMGNEESG